MKITGRTGKQNRLFCMKENLANLYQIHGCKQNTRLHEAKLIDKFSFKQIFQKKPMIVKTFFCSIL